MKRSTVRHQGITILEVLIAMAIALFGLMAVMAIVPYAARQARDGLDMEETAQVGQRALGDVMVMDLANPARWITAGGDPRRIGTYPSFDHYLEGAATPAGPQFRFFHDEAILIDPLFFNSNAASPVAAITHFPYCYAPQQFIDPLTGTWAAFREPLLAAGPPPAFTGQLDASGNPLESIGPYVRRVGLTNPSAPALPMPFAMAREIFETADDLSLRGLTDAEKLTLPQFEKARRQEYHFRRHLLTGDPVDVNGEWEDPSNPPYPYPISSPELVRTKAVAFGATSWLPMLVPMNDSRTLWKLFIIVLRNRNPTFAINGTASNLIDERVARIRGITRYGPNSGFISQGQRGGLIRIESWGTTNLAAGGVLPAEWEAMANDVSIQAGQWVLLSRFDQTGVASPAVRRVYQWYRVTDASAEIEMSPADSVAQAGVPAPVPSRIVTLAGPDWNPGPDTLVFMMNNVEAVYERTIEMPSGLLPTPINP